MGTGSGRRAGLESALREAVRDGRLPAGTPLPSTRGLAQELGLSRGTVTAAYDQLVEEGYLSTRPGSGTTVATVPLSSGEPTRPGPVRALPLHDLRPGCPDVGSFPVRAWLAATRRVLGADTLKAGDPQGRIELRTALADYLGRTRGVRTGPDRIVVTSGFYQSITLLSGVLETGVVATEDPGHNAFREVVRRAGHTLLPLPVDAYGARLEGLDAQVGAVMLTPAHQYPTGVPLHPGRRQELCAWARATGGLVVEDDYDGEFRYDRQPVGALQGMAPEHVVYCGTASKTLGPGLRLGWMVLPPGLVEPVTRAKELADLYTESLGQLVLADLIATHAYDRYVRSCRLRYRRRRELLLDRLAAVPGIMAQGVPAGLHALITPADERRVIAACAARGVAVRGLAELHHDPAGRAQGLMVGFAAPPERTYPAAVDALCAALSA
ncbi:GntR family transcriptional regulator / MocR family aminotransferase [Nonomuraea solani]|uniref:GntR family transcriptional regulator / MocR family aminotransferase n=2 Tax=Nonomuraea solani TaxID=1144553 RepID=A0A1H6F2I3_9ACTN|nr:GntR family transcriptional regulator / MocR family aminotransferase [Nonomuraea solani]